MAKPHLRSFESENRTLCDLPIEGPWPRPLPIVDAFYDAEAACRRCMRLEPTRERPFVRTAPAPARFGARKISGAGVVAIERVAAMSSPVARVWPSAEAAVRSYVRWRIEGEHFGFIRAHDAEAARERVQSTRDPADGGREHAAVDRYRTISRALTIIERAPDSMRYFAGLAFGGLGYAARAAYELAVAGKPITKRTRRGGRDARGWYLEWLAYSHEETARAISTSHRCELREGTVTELRHFFSDGIRAALLHSGELERREEPQIKSVRGFDPIRRMREVAGA